MLRYAEINASKLEVLGENSLCIYISGCKNNCQDCHYRLLQDSKYGDLLSEYFDEMLLAYLSQITCICFLGEGEFSKDDRQELLSYVHKANKFKLKTCIYLGRYASVKKEPWILHFNYIKMGEYIPDYGDLSMQSTNQRFYKIEQEKLVDITKNYFKN